MNDNFLPDCIFPSDNDAEVPTLRLDRQPRFCDIPFLCFGEQKRTFQMNGTGTLHFYTDDYRFSAIYEHPEKILQHNPANIVEPNFSLFNEMPIAFGLQAIYKKRFIARMMQEKGINVFVDLNVSAKFYKLNMLGIPAGYSSFCTRGYSDRLNYLAFEYNLAKSIAGDNELLFVIYGGGDVCKRFAREHGCVYVTPVVTVKKKLEALKKIETNVAFLGEEFSVKNLIPGKQQEILGSQIEDFSNSQLKINKTIN